MLSFIFILFVNSTNAKIALSSSHLRTHPVASDPDTDAPDEDELSAEKEAEIENGYRSLREQSLT